MLKTVTGFLRPRAGRITFEGQDITHLAPHRIIKTGIASVPEGRQLFGKMSVGDNLLLGAYSLTKRNRKDFARPRLEMIFKLFPVLGSRMTQRSETLSGGEQQMLALGRALMGNPKLLALDEPSLGLAPLLVSQMMRLLRQACVEFGLSVLLVEQNARAALKYADTIYVLERGIVVLCGTVEQVESDPRIQKAYLGG